MEKTPMVRVLSVALLVLGLSTGATAELRLFEGFDYNVGENIVGQVNDFNGTRTWTKPTNPGGTIMTIGSGDLEYAGLDDVEDSNLLSVPRPATNSEARTNIPGGNFPRTGLGTLYFSFTLKMTNWTFFNPPIDLPSDTNGDSLAKNPANRKGGFLGGFHGGDATGGGNMQSANGFAAPIYVRREIDYSVTGTDGTAGAQTGRYELGIAKSASAVLEPLPSTSDLAYNQDLSFGIGDTLLIVGQYTFVDNPNASPGNDIAKLWINPVPGEAEPAATFVAPGGTTNYPNLGGSLPIWSYHFRGDTLAPGDFQIDNLRVGDTFADVTPAGSATPDGDFNSDGEIDAADYAAWRKNPGGMFVPEDYDAWRMNFGTTTGGGAAAVPEPVTVASVVIAASLALASRRRYR
jgi:hypothetical protein